MSDRNSGTVKWFNNSRGYGFISCEDKSEDIFVHYRNIRGEGYRSLTEGQTVEFSLAKGEKGLQAEEVDCV
ncbi:cold shock domain protein CspD [Candidatus Endobugula sertula]|uniref:Cold shock domain protein CspD n=1 Tax=Candidatus Endobugula sertula TaxID=62101 RepID=A0A1D2QSY6_9GAMM|nr:cold shock domain protein CspD [Candidatus Endobugula sertula]